MDFPTSFLCPSLKHLLIDIRNEQLEKLNRVPTSNQFVTSDLTFNWTNISHHFGSLALTASSGTEAEPQQFAAACLKVWPMLIEGGSEIKRSTHPPIHLWKWTRCEDLLLTCFKEIHEQGNPIGPLKNVLLLSAIFERAIGNVYLLSGKSTVPFLLRDLLKTEDLADIFGPILMFTSKVLLGTNLALNIRNVCWHGFPAPDEIDWCVSAGLLILISSFGEKLGKTLIPLRPQISSAEWGPFVQKLETSFPTLTDSLEDVRVIVDACNMIPNSHRLYWSEGVKLLNNGDYGHCLLLLLPGIEHLLRCIFCMVNHCPYRTLVAEQHTLYTTMDEILAQTITDPDGTEKENLLRHFLGDRLLEMLMDLFDSYEGPRIRDRLSHGECKLDHIPLTVANHVLCIALLIMSKVADVTAVNLCKILKEAEESYIQKFHPVSFLKEEIKSTLHQLERLAEVLEESKFERGKICSEILEFEGIIKQFSSTVQSNTDDDTTSGIIDCLDMRIPVLYRRKEDLGVIAVLRKIAIQLELTVNSTLRILSERCHLHGEYKLRSRQRDTLTRMFEFLPSLSPVIKCIVVIVTLQLLSLPEVVINSRFLKVILKYVENFSSCASKNRWVEMKRYVVMFCHDIGKSISKGLK